MKKGFILENILSMFIISTFIPIMFNCLLLLKIDDFSYDLQDEIALIQLRRILSVSYDFQANDNCLSFIYKNEQRMISEVNNNLIMQKGTIIILCDVEDVSFVINDGLLYLYYRRLDKDYEKIVYKI